MKLRLFTHLVIPALGILGVGYGLIYATSSTREEKPSGTAQVTLPPTSSFDHAISGSGLVEANTRNISVGSHLSGIVSELMVGEGDSITKDQPLFRLDDRAARAEIHGAESNLSVAKAQLAEAKVASADAHDQLKRVAGLKEGVVVSADRVARLRFASQSAVTRVTVANAAVEEAQARLKSANVMLEKLTVTSPIDGKVLKLSTRVGEFVQAGTGDAPMVVGNDNPLHVRVSLDENDLWRFSKTAKATGAMRSNRNVTFPLTFVRLEPYVMPKTSLTGSMSEKVDTRVLEVVYRIDVENSPVYIGQQVDVFIEETLSQVKAAAPAEPVPAAPIEQPVAPPVAPEPVTSDAPTPPPAETPATAPPPPVESVPASAAEPINPPSTPDVATPEKPPEPSPMADLPPIDPAATPAMPELPTVTPEQ